MKLPALLGNYDRQADQPTDQPPTDTRRHREVSQKAMSDLIVSITQLITLFLVYTKSNFTLCLVHVDNISKKSIFTQRLFKSPFPSLTHLLTDFAFWMMSQGSYSILGICSCIEPRSICFSKINESGLRGKYCKGSIRYEFLIWKQSLQLTSLLNTS